MSKVKAYVSHSIRGKLGVAATEKQEMVNCDKATQFGKRLREEFPNIDFYIPGEHINLDLILREKKYVTVDQLLDVDCTIISRCSFLIVFAPDDYVSKGMKIEIDHCVFNKIPVISAIDGSYDEYVKRIIYAVNCHLTSMMR